MIRVILDTIVSKDTVQIYINNSKKKKKTYLGNLQYGLVLVPSI